MDFSPVVAEELKRYVALPPQDVPAASFRWGGGWFCPADAIVMTEVDGRVVCPSCARAMPGRLIYNLVEFHVHPTPSR